MFTPERLYNACQGKTYTKNGLNAEHIREYLRLEKKVLRPALQQQLCKKIQNGDADTKTHQEINPVEPVGATYQLWDTLRLIEYNADTSIADPLVLEALVLRGLVEENSKYTITELGIEELKKQDLNNMGDVQVNGMFLVWGDGSQRQEIRQISGPVVNIAYTFPSPDNTISFVVNMFGDIHTASRSSVDTDIVVNGCSCLQKKDPSCVDQTDFLQTVMINAIVPTHLFTEIRIENKKQMRLAPIQIGNATEELIRTKRRLLTSGTRDSWASKVSDKAYFHMTDIRKTDPFFVLLLEEKRPDVTQALSTMITDRFDNDPITLLRWFIRTYVLSDTFRQDFAKDVDVPNFEKLMESINRNRFERDIHISPFTLVTSDGDSNYHLIRKQWKNIKNKGLSDLAIAFINHILNDDKAQDYLRYSYRMDSCITDAKGCVGVTTGRHLMDLYTILRMLKTQDIDENEKVRHIYITNGAAHIIDMHQYFAMFVRDNYGGRFLTDTVDHTVPLLDVKCTRAMPNIEIPLKGTRAI